jgi:hypothetical protein
MNEFGAVSPNAVSGIGKGHAGGVSRIPGILGKARLLCGGFSREGRERWTAHDVTPFLLERDSDCRLSQTQTSNASKARFGSLAHRSAFTPLG